MSAEEAYTASRNLITAAMVTLRPTQERCIRHRMQLTDPGRGRGRCATA